MLKKFLKSGFIALVILFLALGLAKAVFAPTELSLYEMRYAKKLPVPKLDEYLAGSFQTETDAALGDQILFSTYYKKLYNELTSRGDMLFTPMLHSIPDKYLNYRDTCIYNGQLINPTVPTETYAESLAETAAYINEEIASIPDVDVYMYYVDNDSDINFETEEKTGTYEYFCQLVDIPEENCAALEIDNFQEYHELFYTGDHHWNHKGSYKGYCQVLELLGGQGEPLIPVEELEVPGIFIGSKALLTGTMHYAERITAYRYDFPPISVSLNGEILPNFGDLDILLANDTSNCSYATVYGDDMGCAILRSERKDGEKLLIVGDSYDNAILKLLACHFAELHSVDVRYYSVQTGELLDLSDYVMDNDIDKVLFLGCSGFFDIGMGMRW